MLDLHQLPKNQRNIRLQGLVYSRGRGRDTSDRLGGSLETAILECGRDSLNPPHGFPLKYALTTDWAFVEIERGHAVLRSLRFSAPILSDVPDLVATTRWTSCNLHTKAPASTK